MILAGILFVAVSLPVEPLQVRAASVARAQPAQVWMPGEVLVCPAVGRGGVVATAVATFGLNVLEQDAVSGVLRVRVPVGQEGSWMQLLALMPEVDYAERNGIGQGGLVPDDTHYGRQWHLRNTGQSGGTSGADIEAEAAWELSTGSSSIVIAVLDTGIDTDHVEFAGRIDPRGFDFVNEDSDPEADHPHGTWVSGCLGANANNGFSTVGVDWSCRILPIKVLDQANLGTTFDLAQGINYAATLPDVRILSMSLINYPSAQILRNALQRARDADKVLIACAGNGGIGNANVSYPGAFPSTISIGATRNTDARAGFSGTGSRLDFVAPGDSVVTTAHNTSANVFSVVSGCSFATPIVSGVVGLMLALADERGLTLTQDDVYELLRLGTEDQVGLPNEDLPGRDDFHGYGRINAYRSLLAVPLVLPLDVKPGACPNPLGVRSKGVLPVALLGSAAADAATIDPGSVTFSRADGVGGFVVPSAGPPGPGAKLVDVGTPFVGGTCGCHSLGGDGVLDLLLFVPTDELVAALELDGSPGGSMVELVARGTLTSGQPFVASDCVRLVPPANAPVAKGSGGL